MGEYGSVMFASGTLRAQLPSNLLCTAPLQKGHRGSKGEQKLTLQMFVLLNSISLSTGAQLAHGLD